MPDDRSTQELLDDYMDQEKLHNIEGRRGVEALCQIAATLGYKDPFRYGQLTAKATLGDLICMLEDNSGLITAMLEWIGERNSPEIREALEGALQEDNEEEEDEEVI